MYLRERRGEATSISDTTGGNNEDGLAGQRTDSILADIHARRDKHRERSITGVSASLTTLAADDIDTFKRKQKELDVAGDVHRKCALPLSRAFFTC